ncbi:MAG: hypothetical protein ACI4XO_06365, partial [Akkermansia sp.]
PVFSGQATHATPIPRHASAMKPMTIFMMRTPFLSAGSFYSILNAEGAQGVDTQRLRANSAQKGAGDAEKQGVENP